MSKTDNYELPIPNDDEAAEEKGYEAILVIRSALIALDEIIDDIATAMSGKAANDATWSMLSIEGLSSALADKMSASAKFALSDLTDTEGILDGATGYILARLSTGKWAPVSPQSAIGTHSHFISEVSGLEAALAEKLDKNGGAMSGALDFAMAETPGDPVAGKIRIYARDDGTLAYRTATGLEKVLGSTGNLAKATKTQAETGTGTDPLAWAPEQVRQSALASQGAAKAWVCFNGTGTVAIKASYNVSSITDNGTGDYTVNFTSPMVDANFAAQVTVGGGNSGNNVSGYVSGSTPKSSSLVRVFTHSAGAGLDMSDVSVSISR